MAIIEVPWEDLPRAKDFRDEIAISAMRALLANPYEMEQIDNEIQFRDDQAHRIAEVSYEMADAMMEARNAKA